MEYTKYIIKITCSHFNRLLNAFSLVLLFVRLCNGYNSPLRRLLLKAVLQTVALRLLNTLISVMIKKRKEKKGD